MNAQYWQSFAKTFLIQPEVEKAAIAAGL